MTLDLELYLTGESAHGRQALENVRALFDTWYPDQYRLEVIDVGSAPHVAHAAGVLMTPALKRASVSPARRVTGDLSDGRRVLEALDLVSR